jgi:hypothetical protein
VIVELPVVYPVIWPEVRMLGTMMQFPLTIAPILERTGKLFGTVEIVSRLPDRSVRRSNYAALCDRARSLAAAGAGKGTVSPP